MQGVALVGIFIKVTPFAQRSGMSEVDILLGVEKYIRKYFGKRGEKVVQENLKCVKHGLTDVKEIPTDIITAGAPETKAEMVAAK